MPVEVGTGAAPHLTLSPYTAMAHGPTIAIAALPSANESAAYFSFGAYPLAYIVAQKFMTALPAASLNVDFPFSTSCLPPDSGAESGARANQDWEKSRLGAGQMAAWAALLVTILSLVARKSSYVESGGFSGSTPAFF